MKNNVYNSSGKVIGYTELKDSVVYIVNNKYQEKNLSIVDSEVVAAYNCKFVDEELAIKLYDEYFLTIGEIASIYNVVYSNVNKIIKTKVKTTASANRRNSSFGLKFSKDRVEKTTTRCHAGKKFYNDGKVEKLFDDKDTIPDEFTLGRLRFSDQHKDKIRQAALNGAYLSPSEISKRGWQKGKFNNVNFKKGIAGYITSKKTNKRFLFRSLLELYYIINYLESSDDVITYSYETIKIHCDNGSLYTPDFLVNNSTLVELKSYRFVYNQPAVKEKFEYKCAQAKKYCATHNLKYKVVFDIDIGFNYEVLLHQLKETKYINDYKIDFLQPERVWSKK